MPYQQGYDYGGYQGYGQAQQAQTYQTNYEQNYDPYTNGQQQQHPMVVIPQQPRQDFSQYYTPPQSFHTQYQTDFYPQYSQQYEQPTQQQYYHPQSQQYYSAPQQQSFQRQVLPQAQVSTQHVQSQASYHQNQFLDPRELYSGVPAPRSHQPQQYSQPRQEQQAQMSPHLPSSPDPLSMPQYQVQSRGQPSQPQQRSQQQAVKPQQRSQKPLPVSNESHHLSDSSQQRVVARVEIPVQHANANSASLDSERSPKRRRSNEGSAVSVYEQPKPKPQQRNSQLHVSQQTASSPLTELPSSQLPPTPEPKVEHQAVLLALADEYIASAYSMSATLAFADDSDERRDEYYALISTAMGCMESALTNYKQADFRSEARLRLRLATLMAEETENDQEIEELLSKGIALCERSRLSDLKYAMHHLLVRVTFKTRPKAALKSIDKLVQEVEALKLLHWMYTFRFLRVSMSLQAEQVPDVPAVLKHLSAINAVAEDSRDVAVQIIAAILETIVHVRSSSGDAAELAQRSMASARTHQLGPETQQMPQARALLDCLDLICSLLEFDSDQIATKMQQMQSNLDAVTRKKGWQIDGSMRIKLTQASNKDLEHDTCGIMYRSNEGDALLAFQWLSNVELYALGYLLSGIANMSKSTSQAKVFIDEGIRLSKQPPPSLAQSLTAATEHLENRAAAGVAMRLQQIFATCAKYEWAEALQAAQEVRKECSQHSIALAGGTERTLLYFEALCQHGLGELQVALNLYMSPNLKLDLSTKMSYAEKDMRVLATLNSIFILRTFGSSEFARAEDLIAAVELYCSNHSNKAIKAVYFIIRATGVAPDTAIIKMKQYLQAAVDASKSAANNQLLCICMNIMTSTFFTNIVGDQAEKSVKAARSLAKRSQDKLWMVAADGMFGDIMERCGKVAEAETARSEARSLMGDLPESLKRSLQT